jgi:hypothetical protein
VPSCGNSLESHAAECGEDRHLVAKQKRTRYAVAVPACLCVVSFSDACRVKHSVEVTAESLFAAALGLQLLRQHDWVEAPGPATRLEVHVSHPRVTHEVSVQQLRSGMRRLSPPRETHLR